LAGALLTLAELTTDPKYTPQVIEHCVSILGCDNVAPLLVDCALLSLSTLLTATPTLFTLLFQKVHKTSIELIADSELAMLLYFSKYFAAIPDSLFGEFVGNLGTIIAGFKFANTKRLFALYIAGTSLLSNL
jgi:hypothetical protein